MLHTKRTDRAADTYADMARYDPLKLRKGKFRMSAMRRGDDYRWKAFKRANFLFLFLFLFVLGGGGDGSSLEHMVVFSIRWG